MLDLTSLKNAIQSLDNAVSVVQNSEVMRQTPGNIREVIEAGVIQNFEFTYELCWKFMVRWISQEISPEEASPRTKRDIFRTAARYGLIRDPKPWFRYAEARNMTSHAYDRKKAETVLAIAGELLSDAKVFYREIEAVNV